MSFSPNGSKLKSLIADIKSELEKMALINPLKNLLLGENNPTIMSLFSGGGASGGGASGILDRIKGLFGSGSRVASEPDIGPLIAKAIPDHLSIPSFDLTSLLGHFAAGTESSPAGPAWVGENGPEIVNLPQGARVTNAADTRRLMTPANDTAPREVHYHLAGNLLTPDFWQQIQSGDDHAAMRGTSGGRALSKQDSFKAARRKLGTR